MKTTFRLLLVICAWTFAHALAAGPDTPPPGGPPAGPATPEATTPSTQGSPPSTGASGAQQSSSPTAASAASTDSANSSTSDAKKKPGKLVLVDNGVNDAELKQILAKGYRPEPHGDGVVYCRSEAQVGTRFKTKTCKSSARILAEELQGKTLTRDLQRDLGNGSGK